MVKNRGRSTALKMALAGMCTALCIEGMLQRGLAIHVYAEDTEDENYTNSQEWQDFKTYWVEETDKQINNFVATQSPELQAQYLTYILAGNMAIANMEYQENALAMRADPNTGAIDYSVDIPAGAIYTGWYYRGGEPRSITVFSYGTNGDSVICKSSIPVISADDFSVSITVTPNANTAFPAFYTSYSSYVLSFRAMYDSQLASYSLSFSGLTGSGIATSSGVGSGTELYVRIGSPAVRTFDAVSYSCTEFISHYSSGYYDLVGCLKDSSSAPISNSRQEFIRAQVGNNFPDFLLDLKQQLDDNFPEDVVNELWYDPTQGEPLPDVGTLDSLTFPPGLPSVQFNDVELPSEPLPAKALQGAGFWFSSFSNMLDALGVKYIVITFLIIALIMAILKI